MFFLFITLVQFVQFSIFKINSTFLKIYIVDLINKNFKNITKLVNVKRCFFMEKKVIKCFNTYLNFS